MFRGEIVSPASAFACLMLHVCHTMQQVRQVPIFLGRKKRSALETHAASETTGDHNREAGDANAVTEGSPERNTTTEAPEGTTQVVEFTLDGKPERFIVAQEVKVDVYYQDPLFDDYALLADSEQEHGGESNGSVHNVSTLNAG